MKFGLFKPDPVRDAGAERIKAWLRGHLGLGDDVTVSVNEIECGDPLCPDGIETVILIRAKASVTRAMKVPGPIAKVNDGHLLMAVNTLGKQPPAPGRRY